MKGIGFTVIVKFWLGPGHPFSDGVTVMVPVVGVATMAAVKLRSPIPFAGNPMAGFEFVQVYVGLPVPIKGT